MSAVVSERVCFSSKAGEEKWWCKVIAVDFNKIQSSPSEQQEFQQLTNFSCSDVLHAAAGVCSVCLPDMELPAIYTSLSGPACKTILVLAAPQEVLSHRTTRARVSPKKTTPHTVKTTPPTVVANSDDESDNPFSGVFSDGESSEESDGDDEAEDVFAKDREVFLSQARLRKSLQDQDSVSSVGSEDCVLGCASILRLPSKTAATSRSSAVQVSVLAVRRRCRHLGIGRQLMQCLKDPGVVGGYDSLVAFVDHKAEGFFVRHGFSEDPILTARYRGVVEHWENSTLMAYTPPFSGGGLAVGSLKTLTHFQEHYRHWRDGAIASYSAQLEMMERLKHELLLLHTKVQSQEDVIGELSQQVTAFKLEKLTIEREFLQYRKHTQKLLRDAAVDSAQEWIKTANTNRN